MQSKFDELPTVSRNLLNKCIGFEHGFPFKNIGVNFNHEQYFLFSVKEEWAFTPPADCEEITVSEYKKLMEGA